MCKFYFIGKQLFGKSLNSYYNLLKKLKLKLQSIQLLKLQFVPFLSSYYNLKFPFY